MQLDWYEPDDPRYILVAEYDAYDTPYGPAKAEAKINKHWSMFDYQTWIHDPYIGTVSRQNYAVVASGSSMEEDDAIRSCETYGYERAMSGFNEIKIRTLYEHNFRKLLEAYINEQYGEDSYFTVNFSNRMSADVTIYEGGYEPVRHQIDFNENTMSFDDYVH